MKLTPSQQAAVTRLGQDVCVLAGPGSGKTSVLTERFAWLVEVQGVDPERILAITFTDKAAQEIRERVQKRLPGANIRRAPISTLHSFCTRVLKEFAIAAESDPSTELFNEQEAEEERLCAAESVLNQAVRDEPEQLTELFSLWAEREPALAMAQLQEAVVALSSEMPVPPEDALSRPGQDFDAALVALRAAPATTDSSRAAQENFAQWLARFEGTKGWERLELLSQFPVKGNLPKAMKAALAALKPLLEQEELGLIAELTAQPRAYLLELLDRVARTYEANKRAALRMDYADLEHKTIRLLEQRPDIRELLQMRCEHILLDEAQDTNPVQWRLLALLRTPGSLFVVGDRKQSIYGFRHAAPELFELYREELEQQGHTIDLLSENFRSRASILRFTEQVLNEKPGVGEFRFEPGRQFSTTPGDIVVRQFAEKGDELDWLVREITSRKESLTVEEKRTGHCRPARWGDFAVLVRTSAVGEAVAAALAAHGIPAVLGGGRGFFDQQEVIDLLQYLAYLANPLDGIAEATVLRSPLVGLSDSQLWRGERDAKFQAFFARQRLALDFTPPDILLSEAMDRAGYTSSLSDQGRANVGKLLDLVRAEWAKGVTSIRRFVERMEAMRQARKEKSAAVVGGDSVQILTIHKAKGLEFPVVFVPAAQARPRADRSSLRFANSDFGKGEVGVKWRHPRTGRDCPDQAFRRAGESQKQREASESERLLFVALTRAEQELLVSWSGKLRAQWAKYFTNFAQDATEAEAEAPAVLSQASTTHVPLPVWAPEVSRLSTATPSGLAKFSACPRRFYLDHLCSLADWPTVRTATFEQHDGSAKEIGTEVHEYLAGLLEKPPSPLTEELAAVFSRSPLGQRAGRAVRVEREFDFVFAEMDLVLEGQIDLWFVEGGEAVIVDYKTDRVAAADVPGRAAQYAMQLAVYKRVLRRLERELPVRAFLHFLRPDVVWEVTEELDESFVANFAAANHYPTAVGAQCERCPHARAACDATL
ncbi:MAG: double-strand break repair helicase AddA [Bryobacter sp.]